MGNQKFCKNCKHGHNHCDKKGLCTYCNIGSVMGRYPVRKDQNDCCDSFEPDEDDDDEEDENGGVILPF